MILSFFFFLSHAHAHPGEQRVVPVAAAATHAPLQGLRQFRQSRHSRHLAAVDRGRPQFRLFPCDAQSDRATVGRGGHSVGVLGRLRHVPSEKVLPAHLPRQSVGHVLYILSSFFT